MSAADDTPTRVPTRVVRADELPEGGLLSRQLGEHAVAVARVDGELHAFGALCPHQFADMAEDGILERGGITCPSHLWHFSLADGRCTSIPGARIPIHPVREQDGWIVADLPEARA